MMEKFKNDYSDDSFDQKKGSYAILFKNGKSLQMKELSDIERIREALQIIQEDSTVCVGIRWTGSKRL